MMPLILAQLRNPVLPAQIGGGSNPKASGEALGGIIGGLVGALILAGFLLSFVFLLTGAVSWIASGGDKAKLEKARDQIINALVGFIIVVGAWAVMSLVGSFFGLEFPNLKIPSIKTASSPSYTPEQIREYQR